MRLVPPLLVSLLLAFLLARSGVGVNLFTVVVLAALAYGVHAAGRLALEALGEPDPAGPAAWALGLTVTSYVVYGLIVVLPLRATVAAGVVLAIVIVADVLRRKHIVPTGWRAVIGFALCVVFAATWCMGPAGAYESVRTQGVLPVWSDYYFHGGLLAQFGDARAFGRGSIYLADHPASFYHFASYALPAALIGALDQPPLAFATALWMPLGFLSMLAGAYALGARLAGAAGGIAALAAVAMLPDTSNYGLHNGYFSFHWNLMAHPGATYALGAAFLSLALLDRWSAERSRAALVASGLLAGATLLFRAHVFLLFVPAWIATAALCSARDSRRRRLTAWLMVAGLGAGAAVASLAVGYLSESGYWRFGDRALHEFLIRVHMGVEPTAYPHAYEDFVTFESPGYALTIGVLMVVAAAFGAFVVLLPAALIVARERGALRPIDATCGFLFLTWLMLVLFAPQPWHGDPTDLIHRPLVLLYACCAIWTFCLVLRVLRWKLWPVLLGASLLALPAVVASADALAYPKFAWGEKDITTRVPPGLVPAAAFLRREAAVGDIFAVAGLTADYATFDLSTQLCALSGMPAYLSRPYFEMTKDGPRKELVKERLAALQRVDRQTDYTAAMRVLQPLRVRWYVVTGSAGPPWDPARSRAAFSDRTVSLYRIP